MNTEQFLQQLTNARPTSAHIIVQENMSLNVWEEAGKPHTWLLAETKVINGETYQAWIDTAYGNVALSVGQDNPTLIDTGKHTVVTNRVLMTDKHYYDSSTYLWRA